MHANSAEEKPYFTSEHLAVEFDIASRPIRLLGRQWIRYDLIMGQCERRTARDLLDFIDEEVDCRRIAELGCGTGVLLSRLAARFPKAQIRASDISGGMLRVCAGLLADRIELVPPQLILVRENALMMAAPGASYDLVVSSFLLDMLESDRITQALAEIRRVLRSGGVAYLAVLSTGVGREKGALAASGLLSVSPEKPLTRLERWPNVLFLRDFHL
jgi:ubiquinone/menaquinone biosynthesis C-methylase UbiE